MNARLGYLLDRVYTGHGRFAFGRRIGIQESLLEATTTLPASSHFAAICSDPPTTDLWKESGQGTRAGFGCTGSGDKPVILLVIAREQADCTGHASHRRLLAA